MFKKGDIVKLKGTSIGKGAWYDVTYLVDKIEQDRRVICTPTVSIKDTGGNIHGPKDDPGYWFFLSEVELAMSEEEVIKEHLSNETKYADEFQAILIGLKHSTK